MPSGKPSAAATKGTSAGAAKLEFTKEQELTALRDMLLIRRFEEKAGQLYGMGAIGGFCHLYIGQEAVVTGIQMVLKQGDQIVTGSYQVIRTLRNDAKVKVDNKSPGTGVTRT